MGNRGPDQKVGDDEILVEVFLNRGPAVFASEIEGSVELSRQQITTRLDELESGGLVYSKQASGRRLWWLTQKGRERVISTIRESVRD